MPLLADRSIRVVLVAPLVAFALGAAPAAHPSDRGVPHSPAVAYGRIEGTVIISSVLVARRPRFRIYNDPGPGALPPSEPRADSSAEMQNVIVYIGSAGAGAALSSESPASAAHPRMAQRDETFDPHILAVLRGTTVDFPNDDDLFHNVFSLSSSKAFDLGRYPKGGSRPVTFDKPGRVEVFCHIHSDMSAIVLVLENSYFTSPDVKGHFVIDSVPPGDYTVVGWHQRIKPVQHKVRVTAGETAKVLFTIPLPAPESP